MSADEINIKITKKEIQRALSERLSGPFKEEILDVLLKLAERSALGYSLLYKAYSGILPIQKYQIGAVLYMHVDKLETWRYNRSYTLSSEFTFQDFIKVKVTRFDYTYSEPYTIQISVTDDNNKTYVYTTSVLEESLQLMEELPTKAEIYPHAYERRE